MLRVVEVEQASVERLNNCINIGVSPRTLAYTAECGGGGGYYKAAFSHFECSALIFFCSLSSCSVIQRDSFIKIYIRETWLLQVFSQCCMTVYFFITLSLCGSPLPVTSPSFLRSFVLFPSPGALLTHHRLTLGSIPTSLSTQQPSCLTDV